jgi:hypothetical protein
MLTRLIAVPLYGVAALTGIAAAQSTGLKYDSPYAAYQPYRQVPLASWRQANDEVAHAASHTAGGASTMKDGHAQPDGRTTERSSPAAPSPAPHARH